MFLSDREHLLSIKPTLILPTDFDHEIHRREVFKWLYEKVQYPGLSDLWGREICPIGLKGLMMAFPDNERILF